MCLGSNGSGGGAQVKYRICGRLISDRREEGELLADQRAAELLGGRERS